MQREKMLSCWLRRRRKEPQAKKCLQSPELEEARKRLFPGASRRNQHYRGLDFSPVSLSSDFWKHKRIYFCCLKPLSLQFVAAAIGN